MRRFTVARLVGKKLRLVVVLVAIVVVAAACGDDGEESSITSGSAESSGCGSQTTLTIGDGEAREITIDGQARSYILYVPSSYDANQPAPLVLNHHGASGTAQLHFTESGFEQTAQQEGIVVAYPDAGDGLWNLDDDSDVGFIDALIDDLAATVCIDLDQVYAAGYSLGGGFSSLLACLLPDRIAAVGKVADFGHKFPPVCLAPPPTPVLGIVGATDTIYSIEEGLTIPGIPDPPGPLAEEAAAWAAINGCDPEPTETTPGEDVVRRDYSCPEGTDLVIYIHPGGHIWPHGEPLDTNSVLWEFLTDQAAP